jgi:hypothetical protein
MSQVPELPAMPAETSSAYSTCSYTLEKSWIDNKTPSQLKREICSVTTEDDDLGELIVQDWSLDSKVVKENPVAPRKNRSVRKQIKNARWLKTFQENKGKSKLLYFRIHKMLNKPYMVKRRYTDHNRTAASFPNVSQADETIDDIFSVLD